MVASSADEALRNAYRYSTCQVGRCLQYVRTWLEIPPNYATAAQAWHGASRRHQNRDVPKGAPMFWTGGSRGFGHIALSTGDGYVRSTDVPYAGMVRTVPLTWFDAHWPNLHFEGWTEDLNETVIPWLSNEPPPPPPPPNTPEDAWMGNIDSISTQAAQAIGVQTATQVWTRYQPGGKALSDWLYHAGSGADQMVVQIGWIMDAIEAIAKHQGVTLPPQP